jgi:hypothetical protein
LLRSAVRARKYLLEHRHPFAAAPFPRREDRDKLV